MVLRPHILRYKGKFKKVDSILDFLNIIMINIADKLKKIAS